MRIKNDDLLKKSRPGFRLPCIDIPVYDPDKERCSCECFKLYVSRTEPECIWAAAVSAASAAHVPLQTIL